MCSVTFQAHLQHLEEVFQQLSWHGLKLQPQKCRLLKREVKYLGYVIEPEGVAMDLDKKVMDSSAFTPVVSGNRSPGEEDAGHDLDWGVFRESSRLTFSYVLGRGTSPCLTKGATRGLPFRLNRRRNRDYLLCWLLYRGSRHLPRTQGHRSG
ncbi:hypothetical protein AAFF_G00154580 [Aldrovandia affinis]|uniref:ribonuclease H n=1 Tax=Aldrovandia affinis TaxID=143900 RepID=A0AAD7T046_9TELE|nr:hypothetical protein AAFF_G00154580 [Aldrovandia affinis]